uniref:Uncharacterized protein n=1 Tax=Palpitomonas bilix TaxID=652834 RepID=A0A7S3DK69_9EUKA|mmetsp:Transcript_41636/g.107701  ORF Transcript_41636/g.107701 Transcript_41636/m.107701 type:complete len:133 (+) Transcript_41636:18-416(+)
MPYGSNAINSDGTSCNVGNTLGSRPAVRLLGQKLGYDSGNAMKNALAWGDDEDETEKERGRRREEKGGERGAGEASKDEDERRRRKEPSRSEVEEHKGVQQVEGHRGNRSGRSKPAEDGWGNQPLESVFKPA